MNLPCLNANNTKLPHFIELWSATYEDKNEAKYERHIGTLTKEAIEELFVWKNGTPLSGAKKKSVHENYISKLGQLKSLPKDTPAEEVLKVFGGGMIWKIFLLHLWQPEKYPIFDQHVYRAMVYMKTGKLVELKEEESEKQMKYLKEYLPFYKTLGTYPERKLDKALWMFGKFLKSNWRKMLSAGEAE